jgi:hypothetical protein
MLPLNAPWRRRRSVPIVLQMLGKMAIPSFRGCTRHENVAQCTTGVLRNVKRRLGEIGSNQDLSRLDRHETEQADAP